MIKVFIADDHYVVRRGLRQILSAEDDISVTAEASNCLELSQKIHQTDWDVLLLDITMPGKSGIDMLTELRSKMPDSKILILSMHKEAELVNRAFRTGANGYLNKDSIPEELICAIRSVFKGRTYIGSTIDIGATITGHKELPVYPHNRLSEREYRVFLLLVSGHSVKDIAADLSISNKTVGTYKTRILEKFNFNSVVELVHYAVKHKLTVVS